jgi:hypothetical protein
MKEKEIQREGEREREREQNARKSRREKAPSVIAPIYFFTTLQRLIKEKNEIMTNYKKPQKSHIFSH